jgi:hypothetical protein
MITTLLHDPAAFGAFLALAGGIGVLVWAVRQWLGLSRLETAVRPEIRETAAETPPPPPPAEPVDLTQQLVERFNQLTERIYLLEREKPEGPAAEAMEKIEMLLNRLLTLEKVVQKNTPQSGTGPFDKEISMAFKALTDRIGILEKAVQNLQRQETVSVPKREVI